MTEIDPRLSDLYREAATETPSAVIDAAILAAARERVATTRRRPPSRWSGWLVPVSLTATLVVGVSLVLLVEREHPEMLQGDLAGSVPTMQDSAPALAERSEERAAATAPVRDAAPARRAAPLAADTHETKARPAAPLPQAETMQAKPPVAESLPAEPIGGSAAKKATRESSPAADTAAGLGAAAAPAAARMAPPATPEAWLEAIRRLKHAGRDHEAATQLVEFRKAYPDHAVPEDLAGPTPPASRDD